MKRLVFLLYIFMVVSFMGASASNSQARPCVKLETTAGVIVIELYNETPLHRDNFLKLAREGYYDGLLFHRVIRNFMIQGGDPDSRDAAPGKRLGEGGPNYTLPAEFDVPRHYHVRGAVAAAREGDNVNPERRSSGSQFYIVWGQRFGTQQLKEMAEYLFDETGGKVQMTAEMHEAYHKIGGTPHLDGQYTVFGEVKAGLEVVEAIQAVRTDYDDRPLEDVRIIRATVIE